MIRNCGYNYRFVQLFVTEMGVLIGKGGFHGNVFRITPPLCFTKEDAGTFSFYVCFRFFGTYVHAMIIGCDMHIDRHAPQTELN